MDPSLTDSERRFVLAEMIKTSQLDIASLANFVRMKQIEPDWMSMQLPNGRNMNQCMQAAEQMAIPSPSLKRRSSNDHTEHTLKRLATMDRPEYSSPASRQANWPAILPRPTNGDYREPLPPPKVEPKKKRGPGRPRREDRILPTPQPLLPRLPAMQSSYAPHSSQFSPAPEGPASHQAQNSLAPPAAKRAAALALPASPTSAGRPITPPEAYMPASRSPSSPRGRASTASPRGGRPRPLEQKVGSPRLAVTNTSARPVSAE